MTQVLFAITVIFVVYVLYEVFKVVARTDSASAALPEPAKVAAPAPAPKTPVAAKPAAAPKPAAPSRSSSRTKPAPAPAPVVEAPPTPATAEDDRGAQMKNPETGEVTPFPTNYRFAKKWVKDALVNEGLLDKVYKPSELDDAGAAKAKDALEKFRALHKYQA